MRTFAEKRDATKEVSFFLGHRIPSDACQNIKVKAAFTLAFSNTS